MNQFDAHIRRRIRAIIVRQKKTDRILFNHLRAQGVTRETAGKTAFASCGIWRKSNLPGMRLAYRNIWFVGKITNLWREWNRFNAKPIVVPTQLTLEF